MNINNKNMNMNMTMKANRIPSKSQDHDQLISATHEHAASKSLGSLLTNASQSHGRCSNMNHDTDKIILDVPRGTRINPDSIASTVKHAPACTAGSYNITTCATTCTITCTSISTCNNKTMRTANSSTYSGLTNTPCNQSQCSTCDFPTANSIYMHVPLAVQSHTFDTDENSQDDENERNHQTGCINGLKILGTSFGGLLGIAVPVQVIDKVPKESSQCSGSVHSSTISRSSLTPTKQGRVQSISTPATRSVRSEGTIPFLPELLLEPGQQPQHQHEHLDYQELSTRPHQIAEVNLDGGGGGGSLWVPDVFSELAANNYSVAPAPPKPVNDQDVSRILRKASQAEVEGNYALALDSYEKCREYYTRNMKQSMDFEVKSFTDLASILHLIGVVHWKTGAYDESLDVLGKARRGVEKALILGGKDEERVTTEQLCDILNTLGRVYSSKGNFEAAMDQHSESLSILRSLLDTSKHTIDKAKDIESPKKRGGGEAKSRQVILHPGIAKALICMGNVHSNCGRLSMAMELFKGGLEIQRNIHGSKHVDLAATLNAIGSVYEKTGRHEKGMQCYKKALQIYKKQLGGDHVDYAISLNNIGQIYHHVGKYQKAMHSYREALKIMKQVLGVCHRNCAVTLFNIGLIHVQCCQYDKAMHVFKETLQFQRGALGDGHVDVALTLEAIGGIYQENLRVDRALNCYYEALNIRQASSGGNIYIGVTLEKIGKCQMNLNGDFKEAIHCFKEALKIYRLNGLVEDDPLLWEARKNYVSVVTILEQQKKVMEDELIGLDITI